MLFRSLSTLTVMEAAELSKMLEETWGVSAAAPVAVAMAAAPAESAEAVKSEFDVILTNAGTAKINVIKEVKNITGLGLAESKALVDAAPKAVKSGVGQAEADDIKAKLEAAGASVEIK